MIGDQSMERTTKPLVIFEVTADRVISVPLLEGGGSALQDLPDTLAETE